jgi:hypothetical protein
MREVALLLLIAAMGTRASAQANPADWLLSEAPQVDLRNSVGAGTDFYFVTAAWKTPAGLIVVVNAASLELRVFDASGSLVDSFGRRGRGPGEFLSFQWVGHAGDTSFVADRLAKRITSVVLSRESQLVDTRMVSATGGKSYGIAGRLTGNRWLVLSDAELPWGSRNGVHRLQEEVGVVDSSGAGRVNWIAKMPASTHLMFNPTGNVREAVVGFAAFSPALLAVAASGIAWYGDSFEARLYGFNPATGRRSEARLPLSPEAVSADRVAAARARELDRSAPAERRFTMAKYGQEHLPARLPFFEKLIAGDGDEIWVELYGGGRSAPARYLVLDRDGQVVATLTTPPGFRITSAGRDHVVGVHKDEDELESVRVYALTRNRRPLP